MVRLGTRGVGATLFLAALVVVAPDASQRQQAPTQTVPPADPPFVLRQPRPYPVGPPPSTPSPVERLGKDRLRIGAVFVDLGKKEVSVAATVNDAPLAEFVANTKGGFKSYESVLEAETNALNFDLGLTLIGLDRAHSVSPQFHFDPVPPQGDPVDVWVSWGEGSRRRRVRADELIYDEGTKKTLPVGKWVYIGSRIVEGGLVADLDGVLIGFVHTPAPLIERVDPVPGPYGAIKMNPNLGLKPGDVVTLTVRALPSAVQRGN